MVRIWYFHCCGPASSLVREQILQVVWHAQNSERKRERRKKKGRKERRKEGKKEERKKKGRKKGGRKEERKKEVPSDHSPNCSCLGDSLKSYVRIQTGPMITLSVSSSSSPAPPPKSPATKNSISSSPSAKHQRDPVYHLTQMVVGKGHSGAQ